MKKIIMAYPLDIKVLAVAVVNIKDYDEILDWTAYVKDVPGWNHEVEKVRVAQTGSKISKELAHVMFPRYDIEKYRL